MTITGHIEFLVRYGVFMFCFYIWDKSLKITEKCSNVKVIVENCNSQQIDTVSQ